jgi:hypothetical protein
MLRVTLRWPQRASGSVPVPGLPAGTGRDQAPASARSAASEVLASLNWPGMLASVSWPHVLQARGGSAVGLGFGQRAGDEPAGVPGLAAGELVRAGFPGRGDAQAFLVGLGQAGQRGADLGEVSGPAVALGQLHAQQQGPRLQLPGPHPGREQCLDGGRGMRGAGDFLQAGQRYPGARARVTGSCRRAASPRAAHPRPGRGRR